MSPEDQLSACMGVPPFMQSYRKEVQAHKEDELKYRGTLLSGRLKPLKPIQRKAPYDDFIKAYRQPKAILERLCAFYGDRGVANRMMAAIPFLDLMVAAQSGRELSAKDKISLERKVGRRVVRLTLDSEIAPLKELAESLKTGDFSNLFPPLPKKPFPKSIKDDAKWPSKPMILKNFIKLDENSFKRSVLYYNVSLYFNKETNKKWNKCFDENLAALGLRLP